MEFFSASYEEEDLAPKMLLPPDQATKYPFRLLDLILSQEQQGLHTYLQSVSWSNSS